MSFLSTSKFWESKICNEASYSSDSSFFEPPRTQSSLVNSSSSASQDIQPRNVQHKDQSNPFNVSPQPSSLRTSSSFLNEGPVFRLSPNSSTFSRCLSEFEIVEKLGKGAFGDVFRVINRLDGCTYALKRIKLGNDDNKNSRILREVSALSRLSSHHHIVRYYQAWIEEVDSPMLDSGTKNGDDSIDFSFDSEDDDMVWDPTSAIKKPSNCLQLTCHICNCFYDDWEVSFRDWRVLEANIQTMNLCQECYKDQLQNAGISSDQLNITIKAKSPHFLYIQMEFCEITLREAMDNKTLWSEKSDADIWSMFRQIVEATFFIHTNACMHRDLKPGNIFISSNGTIKVGDFGLATGDVLLLEATNSIRRRNSQNEEQMTNSRTSPLSSSPYTYYPSNSPQSSQIIQSPFGSPSSFNFNFGPNFAIKSLPTKGVPLSIHVIPNYENSSNKSAHEMDDKTTEIGTQMYRGPELSKGRKYNEKIDIFSLGIILFEMWHPFDTTMERFTVLNQLRQFHRFPLGFEEKYSKQSELILRLIQNDSSERPTAAALLSELSVCNQHDVSNGTVLQKEILKISAENVMLKEEMNKLKAMVSELTGLVNELSSERNKVQN